MLQPLYSNSENPDQVTRMHIYLILSWLSKFRDLTRSSQHSNPQNMRKAIHKGAIWCVVFSNSAGHHLLQTTRLQVADLQAPVLPTRLDTTLSWHNANGYMHTREGGEPKEATTHFKGQYWLALCFFLLPEECLQSKTKGSEQWKHNNLASFHSNNTKEEINRFLMDS